MSSRMNRSRRIRSEAPAGISTWGDADKALKRIGEHEGAVMTLEANMNDRINEIKAEYKSKARPYKDAIDSICAQLEEFCADNRADFGKLKSRVLTFGKLGWRKSTRITLRKVAEVIMKLKALGLEGCIRVKESVDRDKLKDLDDATLLQVGARRKVEDVFFVEPIREEILGD